MEQEIMMAMAAMKTECSTLSLLEHEGKSHMLITKYCDMLCPESPQSLAEWLWPIVHQLGLIHNCALGRLY